MIGKPSPDESVRASELAARAFKTISRGVGNLSMDEVMQPADADGNATEGFQGLVAAFHIAKESRLRGAKLPPSSPKGSETA
jgi:hypothetical protein